MRQINKTWFLNQIHVSPQYQNLGVGKMLLRTGVAHGIKIGLKRCELDVSSDNAKAMKWYMKLGFKEFSETWYLSFPVNFNDDLSGYVSLSPQFHAAFDRFGFGEILVTGNQQYRIGVLGKSWFRSTSVHILEDKPALTVLNRFDSERQLLILDSSKRTEPPKRPLVKIMRMATSLSEISTALH